VKTRCVVEVFVTTYLCVLPNKFDLSASPLVEGTPFTRVSASEVSPDLCLNLFNTETSFYAVTVSTISIYDLNLEKCKVTVTKRLLFDICILAN
jgi:hypothetical protein